MAYIDEKITDRWRKIKIVNYALIWNGVVSDSVCKARVQHIYAIIT